MAETSQDQKQFEAAIETLHAEVTAAAALTNDAQVRQLYQTTIGSTASKLREDALAGRITWAEASQTANQLRNDTMELLRGRSTAVGRAMAESRKQTGLTFNAAVAKYTQRLFGAEADFNTLTGAQRNAVYGEIVAAAGRSNPRVSAMMVNASRAGRALLILSLAVSVYNVATSDHPVDTALKEGAVTGAGILGGMAGGAAAGLACGPGAPVCVAIGAFAGGALAALGVSWFW